jgi:hypothetical protein
MGRTIILLLFIIYILTNTVQAIDFDNKFSREDMNNAALIGSLCGFDLVYDQIKSKRDFTNKEILERLNMCIKKKFKELLIMEEK